MMSKSRRPLRTAFVALLAGVAALSLGACHHRRAHVENGLPPSKVTTIGVNAYLWRASLDTLRFMSLVQTDSNGGVIVTDWYINPSIPSERIKVTVTILDQDLRADALGVAAQRQTLTNGQWTNAPVQAATIQKLEDIILTRARDLRQASVAG